MGNFGNKRFCLLAKNNNKSLVEVRTQLEKSAGEAEYQTEKLSSFVIFIILAF